jgi:hypothetical protein
MELMVEIEIHQARSISMGFINSSQQYGSSVPTPPLVTMTTEPHFSQV